MGRYLQLDDMTKLDIPKTESQLLKETQRLKEKKKQEDDTGVIVHEMSQYMGMRVHLDDVSDIRSFSLLSELFFFNYSNIGVGVQGLAKHMSELFNRTLTHHMKLHADTTNDITAFTSWFFSHEQLREFSQDLRDALVLIKTTAQTLTSTILEGYEVRSGRESRIAKRRSATNTTVLTRS